MALLRAELYHTLDDLEELSVHLPDASADGAWKYMPSLAAMTPDDAAMTPDAVSSCANVVSNCGGPKRKERHGAPERHQFRGLGGGLYGVGRSANEKCC